MKRFAADFQGIARVRKVFSRKKPGCLYHDAELVTLAGTWSREGTATSKPVHPYIWRFRFEGELATQAAGVEEGALVRVRGAMWSVSKWGRGYIPTVNCSELQVITDDQLKSHILAVSINAERERA